MTPKVLINTRPTYEFDLEGIGENTPSKISSVEDRSLALDFDSLDSKKKNIKQDGRRNIRKLSEKLATF